MPAIYLFSLVVIFFAVFGIVMLLLHYLTPNVVQKRLQLYTEGAVTGTGAVSAKPTDTWVATIAKLSSPFAKLAAPEEGWDKSALRTRFMNAGFRGEHAPIIYFGLKTLLAIALPILLWLLLLASGTSLSSEFLMLYLVLAAAAGFYFPNLVLARIVAARQLEIFEHFPDVMDLMTVCIEAGLAMDAAFARIAEEMAWTTPLLSEELHLVTLEMRAGNSKEKALRNLALRTGVDDVDALVAMLIQAERFGTSIADSLRVHSDSLRTRRRQIAEETAAKIALKLLFPLIFCIFPALLLVVLGPAMIQIYRTLLPGLGT
ncbi:type II secretion system F family protein [Paraherbaspirillum soli]|uniref:Type II secretion system F family protein n=1 Tax=Paraherbaspirillum soli TaxID=631222 RepID=A0ABW0MCW6_9BURK